MNSWFIHLFTPVPAYTPPSTFLHSPLGPVLGVGLHIHIFRFDKIVAFPHHSASNWDNRLGVQLYLWACIFNLRGIAVTSILSNSSLRPRLGVDYVFSLSQQEDEICSLTLQYCINLII